MDGKLLESVVMPTMETRARAGLSQSQLAERAGISVRTVQGYEHGRREPKWSHVCALAKGLGVPLTRFAL